MSIAVDAMHASTPDFQLCHSRLLSDGCLRPSPAHHAHSDDASPARWRLRPMHRAACKTRQSRSRAGRFGCMADPWPPWTCSTPIPRPGSPPGPDAAGPASGRAVCRVGLGGRGWAVFRVSRLRRFRVHKILLHCSIVALQSPIKSSIHLCFSQ